MKTARILALCISTIVLSLCLCACGASGSSSAASSASAGTSSAAASSASASSADSASSQTSLASTSSAATSTASASAASATVASDSAASGSAISADTGFTFVDDCIDEHGNITLYALTELKGWQVATLLDQQEYEFNESSCTWVRPYDGAQFSALKQTGLYTIDTYNEMNEKGGAIVAVGINIVAGFKDPQAALQGNAKCVIEDSYFNGTDGIAIFYGPSMKEYLALIGQYSESTTQIMVFSQEAIGSGMADQLLGTPVGGSFNEVWKTMTGQDSYGH